MEHSVPGGECGRLEWERHTGSSYVEQDEGQETLGKMEFSVWAEWKTANEWVITGQMSNSSKRGLVLEIQGKLQKKKKKANSTSKVRKINSFIKKIPIQESVLIISALDCRLSTKR